MGNLHAGHLALVAEARRLADKVVASIYVNPTQFGQGEDFGQYPRSLEQDLQALDDAHCDLAFVPDEKEIYPFGHAAAMRLSAPPELADILEGASRPGHFDGVVTVVSRLFNLVQPDVAVFGEKDYQQLIVIRRMVEDMGFALRIHGHATVRESSGLALSSRNRYLDDEQKTAAGNISTVLDDIVRALDEGENNLEELESEAVRRLNAQGLRPDYVAIRRAADLSLPQKSDQELRVLAAAWCGRTRLIDNQSANRVCNHAN
jgi:pantoate--beta-alanine ligase